MRKLLALTIMAVMALMTLSASAFTVYSGDYEYEEYEGGGIEITRYNGKEWDLTVPATIDGRAVKSIGQFAFMHINGLMAVTIPEGVENIERDAFLMCENLKSVTLPDSVTAIGICAFAYCDVREFHVSDTNPTFSVVDGALYNDVTHSLIYYPISGATHFDIPRGIEVIDGAFYGCVELYSVTIPDSVTYIGESAFCDCKSLMEIYIPDSVTTIGVAAISGCYDIQHIDIPDTVTVIDDYAFSGNRNLIKLIIPEGVTRIGYDAFWLCDNLTLVVKESTYAHWYVLEEGIPYELY